MVYPENFESRIGFDVVRAQCRALCTMRRSVALLDEERFSTSEREIARRQGLADEMRRVLMSDGDAFRDDFFDIDSIVEKIRVAGTFLDAAELVRLGATLSSAAAIVESIRSREQKEFANLHRLSRDVVSLSHIVREIGRIIDEFGNVRDSASPELAAVRSEIRRHQGQVSKRLQQVLQSAKSAGIVEAEATVSIREGRAVIPVAAVNKRKLQGFIHDESATGKTFYVEPVEVVELNNRLKELEYAERREVVRVLTAFTDMVRPEADAVEQSGEFVACVDMIRSKARWAIENGAVNPILSDGELWLRTARHPLLAQTLQRSGRELVPLDARLDAEHRILVISGPNAGGKSVCLKTFGLIQYMFQCGFPVTCSENSELPVFRKLYIDIGDQQSIENDLSTYSSHLLNMKAMLAGADGSTMVLIDEFGSGTEPTIGAALAESILERLVDSGCYGVITTHYSNIKYYASATEGVLNGAMTFDVQNIRPLFRLETGKPGSSFAIEIARKIGLPESIIASAREKVGSDHIDMEKQLREIARDKRYWESKRKNVHQKEKELDEMLGKVQESTDELKKSRKQILKDAREEAERLLRDANAKIENTIRTIVEAKAEKERTRQARQELSDFSKQLEEIAKQKQQMQTDREMAKILARQERKKNGKKDKGNQQQGKQGEQSGSKPVLHKIEPGMHVRLMGVPVILCVRIMWRPYAIRPVRR